MIKIGLFIFCGILVLQTSFFAAEQLNQSKLKELIADDMQYYEHSVKPSGKNAQIYFLNVEQDLQI